MIPLYNILKMIKCGKENMLAVSKEEGCKGGDTGSGCGQKRVGSTWGHSGGRTTTHLIYAVAT